MSIRLVDPVFLRVPKKIVVEKKIRQSKSIDKKIVLIFIFLIMTSLMYFVYDYVKKTPIVNPDLDCLPKNIRNTVFCKSIEAIARHNRGKLKVEPESKLKAYNDDELTIKFFNAP